jgi:hypothetical protein
LRHLRENSDEPVEDFKIYTPKQGIKDQLFLDYCFKSIILTFNGRPSVINNFFEHSKMKKGGALPSPDEIDTFLQHLSLNQKHGTTDGGIFNQQWTVCPELNSLRTYKEFITGYASIHQKRFFKDVLEASVDDKGTMNRKKVLDNWVKLASSGNHYGAGTTLKFRFHIHQAMLNIENVFGRVFGEETLDSICVYHGSKEGWNKLCMNDEVILMKSSMSKQTKDNIGCTIGQTARKKVSKREEPKSRTVRLDDDSIQSMSDLMSNSEYHHLMSYFESLTKEQLSVLLIEKDEKGLLTNKVNGLSIGPSFLEHVLCILQYYLRRLSSGYNVSQRNEFDRPNFQPLKFNCDALLLSNINDPSLWKSIETGIKAFETWAGTGKEWKDVIHHPPDLFMIEEELKLIHNTGEKKSGGKSLKRSNPRKAVKQQNKSKKKNNVKATFPKNTTATPPERELPQRQKPYNTRTKKRSFDDM